MIRSVNQNDIPECVSVIRKSFMTVAEEFDITAENAPRFTAFATTEERLLQHLEAERRPMYVYCDGGKICGFYSLCPLDGGGCELNNLSVLPEYRHRGIGKALLDHAIGTARTLGFKKMHLGIVEENAVLRNWYEQNGARHIGTKTFDFFPFTCGYMIIDL